MKILIIEDDTDINNMLAALLRKNGFETASAFSGTEGLLLHGEGIDLILLDLMLPGKSGDLIISDLKKKNNVPVIITSAVDDIDKKVGMFELGADDYITKPFHNEELLARINARLRTKPEKSEKLSFGDIVIDEQTETAMCCGNDLHLSKTEFDLLRLLVKNQGNICTKSVIYDSVWDYEESADDNTLNVHISKLRKKLKSCGESSECIETVWGIGYRMKKN